MSINIKDYFVDDELYKNDCYSNDLNTKTNFHNDGTAFHSSLSKVNSLSPSSSIVSMDKTITDFSIQMLEQLIRDEELGAKQHHTILCLKEKSLVNRLKWEVNLGHTRIKNLKNQPHHEKQLQLLKRQQRGRIIRLEYSLSQIKRLNEVIDTVHKQRIIIFEEHIKHLRMQPFSKKVMPQLKNSYPTTKRGECLCRPLNSYFLKQCDRNSDSSTSSIMFELAKPTKIAQNQAANTIGEETKHFQKFENIEVQKDVEWSSQPTIINKPIQTSIELSNHNKNENIQTSFISSDLNCKHELSDVYVRPLSPVLPLYNAKRRQCISETSINSSSEQSDSGVCKTALQGQLEIQKLEFFELKREHIKLRLESLKEKEHDLLKQIELYDKEVEESRKISKIGIDKKKNQVKKSSFKHDFSTVNISDSIAQDIIKNENNHTLEGGNTSSYLSSKIPQLDANKYSLTATKKLNNESEDKLMYEVVLQKTSEENPKRSIKYENNNCNLIHFDGKYKNQLFQFLEKNPVQKFTLSKRNSTTVKGTSLRETHEIQSDVNNNTLNDLENSFNEKISNKYLGNINGVGDINLEVSSCENTIQNTEYQKILNTLDKKLQFENFSDFENSTTSRDTTHFNVSNINTSNSSDTQKQLPIDFNENISLNKKRKNYVGQLNILKYNESDFDDNYSSDLKSDENSPEFQISYKFNKFDDNKIELDNTELVNESSYEEERNGGDVMYEVQTFIGHYLDEKGVQNMKCTDEYKIDVITNIIFSHLLEDTKEILKFNAKIH